MRTVQIPIAQIPIAQISTVQIPPGITDPEKLQLIKTRNIKARLDFYTGLKYLHRTGLPDLTLPENFVSRTLEYEEELGTAQAALIGLHVASGIDRILDVIDGLTIFHDITQGLAKQYNPTTPQGMYMFQHKLGPRLKFVADRQDIFQGLAALQGNLALTDISLIKEVGNSTICSALFSLIILAANGLAGEGHNAAGDHSFAYLPLCRQTYIYDNTQGLSSFYRFGNDNMTVLTSVFSFISTLILAKAKLVLGKKKIFDFDLFKTAMKINPYYIALFRLRALDKMSKPQENLIYSYEIRKILSEENLVM